MCKKWQPYSSCSPSFLRKEVPRRGGGWLPQRIEKEWEEAVPPFVIHHGKIQMLVCFAIIDGEPIHLATKTFAGR